MKTIIYFLILILMFLVQSEFSQKLTIIEQDYEQAKLESQKQNKMLLIDFYTTWCGPCKQIDKLIFKDPAISGEMSKSFVVLKYDAEKDETHRLTLKHHVGGYPSSVVLNPNQFVVHKMLGLGGAEKDLAKNYQAFLKEAIAKYAENYYVKGVSNTAKDLVYPKFYEDYVFRKNTNLDEKALKDYWDNNKDYLSEVSFAIFSYFHGTGAVEEFFIENIQKYEDLYGKLDVNSAKRNIVFTKYAKAVETKDRKLLATANEVSRKLFGKETTDKGIDGWEQYMLIAENRWIEAVELFVARRKRENLDEDYVDNFCSTVYRKSTDKKALEKCVSLMKDVIDKNPKFDYLNTYAYLLYKTGDFKRAKITLEKAIAVGKLNNEDIKDSEKWLKAAQDKINQKPPGK